MQQKFHVPQTGRLLSQEEHEAIRKHHREQRREELRHDLPMKILQLQESELVKAEMEWEGVIPLTEQEMETMELNELWEQLRMIRNAQNWGGPTLLGEPFED